ncbi:hypothetical protein PF001_g28638 [Phytophthora fragariae]|uniref:Uncharacterized protein n=1 Tax=Phytophthora fragariae TaxID=53985 RepID=A0A6A4BDL9_9STRA|nr:hypothetical protein PF001_g28638 [Phytophthora fragariae]
MEEQLPAPYHCCGALGRLVLTRRRDTPSSAEYDAPLNCTGNIAGDFPVTATACSARSSPCARAQSLATAPALRAAFSAAPCVIIQTGVYGYVLHPLV